MPNLFSQAYDKAEEYQGRKLVRLLIILFIIFLLLGVGAGVLLDFSGIGNDGEDATTAIEPLENDEVSFSGTITYLDPHFYPQDEINYYLSDSSGDEIVLLKSSDQKLEVSEGHFATLYGYLAKTFDGTEDVLIVDRVVIKNVTN